MKLFQYWDTGEPPDDVAGWIEGFRAKNPEMKHRLFDRDSASHFIAKHFGQRERLAFEALAVPAAQADYFRLCALVAEGGVWFDADCKADRPLSTLVERVPALLLPLLDEAIINSTLIARTPGNPFLSACVEASTSIIEERLFEGEPRLVGIPSIAGPRLMSAVRRLAAPVGDSIDYLGQAPPSHPVWRAVHRLIGPTDALRQALAEATFLHLVTVQKWGRPVEPAYKSEPQHWLAWKGSFYRSPAARLAAVDQRA